MEDEFDGEPRIGGHDFVFVDELSQGQTCPVCLLAMRSPVQTVCGHRFCESCLLETFRFVLFVRAAHLGKQTIPNCSYANESLVEGSKPTEYMPDAKRTSRQLNFLIQIPSGGIMIPQFVQKIGIPFLKMEG